MLRLPRSIGQTLVPVLGFVIFANMGCATAIATQYPHLDRRSVCLLVPGIESDSTEYIFTKDNVPVSNFHPDVVDEVAASARTVFEYDPHADPDSVRYLPAPHNELQCPERFSMLPSGDAKPLPEASVDLLVHERRPEPVPLAVAEKLANCATPLQPMQYTATLNVYVTNDGQAVSAFVVDSTLGNRKAERCIVNALRTTLWAKPAVATPVAYVTPAAPAALKAFLAQPAPAAPVPNWLEESGIRRIQPQPTPPPASNPGGIRPPGVFVIPLGPLAAAGVVFGIIFFWSDNDAPAWASELNPISGQPYTSLQEYEGVRRLSPQEILQRQQAQIKATQSQPPPAPAPSPQAQPAPQKQPDPKCDKIAAKIDEIINAERKAPPKNGYPQGRKGIKWRWRELAANEGKWGYKPDGSLGDKLKGHMNEYERNQADLIQELNKWKDQLCDDKGHTLPRNALQYAAQKPEIGPGKPLEPAPTPIWERPATPAVIPPQRKK